MNHNPPISAKTLADLEWATILQALADRCATSDAKSRALSIQLSRSVDEANQWLTLTGESVTLHRSKTPLPIEATESIVGVASRLKKEGTLNGQTLIQLANALRNVSCIAQFLGNRSHDVPALCEMSAKLQDLNDVWQTIDRAIEPSGAVADDASPALLKLRREGRSLAEQIRHRMKQFVDNPTVSKHLQDTFYTQRDSRYVLPVRTDAGPVIDGIVLDTSSSGATVFVEPTEIVPLNNDLQVIQAHMAREEARILTDLSRSVAEHTAEISANLDLLTELDLINARGLLALAVKGTLPQLSRESRTQLYGLRHPLMVLANDQTVANDLTLEPTESLLITGPNAGGKTVCLKAIGLAALMVRGGMFPSCGPGSELPYYERIFSDIGDGQSIADSLSTFTSHLSHVRRFLNCADRNSLVLVDEAVSGTDPNEGAALAQAILEALVNAGAQVVATTHYSHLKRLPLVDSRFQNASVGFDPISFQPTFKLHGGTPGGSFALQIARLRGLPDSILERAEALIGTNVLRQTEIMQQLVEKHERLSQLEDQASRASTSAKRLQEQYERKLTDLKDKGFATINAEVTRGLDEVRKLRSRIEQLNNRATSATSKQAVKKIDEAINDVAADLLRHEQPPQAPNGKLATFETTSIGATVWVSPLSGLGRVVARERTHATVQIGAMRTQAAYVELILPAISEDPDPNQDTPTHQQINTRTVPETYDLRGMRVDEALRECDRLIDLALLSGFDTVRLVHGYGTGALRDAIRSHLSFSRAVEDTRSGNPDEGGNGVTIVRLR